MDYHLLNLGEDSSLVQSMRILDWGSRVVIDCIYSPLRERSEYQLVFAGCTKVTFDVTYPESSPSEEEQADLIGISLGKNQGKQPAVITTDLFELHITYDRFECVKGVVSSTRA